MKENKIYYVCGRCPWGCKVISDIRPSEPPHTCLNGQKAHWTRRMTRSR